LRVAAAVALTIAAGYALVKGCGSSFIWNVFLIATVAVFILMTWVIAVGFPLIGWLGEKAAGIYTPSDKGFRVRPEFSIAEAHAKAGRYTEAIVQFRRDIEQFPDEPMPHIRIADIQLEHFHSPAMAFVELQAALSKARSADAFALLSHRLADLTLAQPQTAIGHLREIERRYPGTKHAKAAAERIAKLAARKTA